jgi:hypothetical protein
MGLAAKQGWSSEARYKLTGWGHKIRNATPEGLDEVNRAAVERNKSGIFGNNLCQVLYGFTKTG